MPKGDSYKWVVLAISFLLMTVFALSLQVLPPLFEQITKDIPFSNFQAGMLMGAYAVAGIFLPFVVVLLAKRFSFKKLIILALLIMIISLTAFSFSKTFSALLIFRVVAGVGATVLVVLAPLIVTLAFDQKNIGVAMGIFNIAVPLGTVFAANVFGYLGQLVNWRLIIQGIAVYVGVILALVILVLSIPKERDADKSSSNEKEPKQKFKVSLGLWFLGAIWAIANAQLLAYITFGPSFYQNLGLPVQKASFLTSMIMLIPIFLTPFAGIAFDKIKQKKILIVSGSIIMAISFVLVVKSFSNLSLWAAALGIGFTPIPVFVFSILPRIVKPEQVGLGLGMLTAASNLGVTLGPVLLGSILDITGNNFFTAYIILAVASLVNIFLAIMLKVDYARN